MLRFVKFFGFFIIGVISSYNAKAQVYANLVDAIVSSDADKTYDMSADENVATAIGAMGGTELTINGNGNNITGNGFEGINVASGKALNIKNVGTVSGFASGYGGFLSNNGTISIIEANFDNNRSTASADNDSGGAIMNANGGHIETIIGNFTNNTSYNEDIGFGASSGAIYNNTASSIGDIIGNFENNSARNTAADGYSLGGAIYSRENTTIKSITGNFINNSVSSFDEYASGGAIANGGEITSLIGDFVGNSSSAESSALARGGAIYFHSSSIVENIKSDFIENYATSIDGVSRGGAIYNDGQIGNLDGNFDGNYIISNNSDAQGGAIFNLDQIGNINGKFSGNYVISNSTLSSDTARGGAILNGGTIGDLSGLFEGNYLRGANFAYGGAIYNGTNDVIGNISADFVNNNTTSTSNNVFGGAISNDVGVVGNISGNFIGNSGISNRYANSGALFNSGTMGDITGNFINNFVQSGTSYAYAGAIGQAANTINLIQSRFEGNYALSTDFIAYGGAIRNIATITTLDSTFINNYAQSQGSDTSDAASGGAIYNDGNITSLTSYFSGNYASTVNGDSRGGAVYSDGSITNFNADFDGNYAISENNESYGGAIYNIGTIENVSGSYKNNYAKTLNTVVSDEVDVYGGAFHNNGDITNLNADFSNNYTYSDSRYALGGALSNSVYIKNVSGTYTGNYATSNGGAFVAGGGIYNPNGAEIENIVGDFIGNYASSVGHNAFGGAIDNRGTIGNVSGNFIGNYVKSEFEWSWGGAILTAVDSPTVYDSNFFDNYAINPNDASGAAVYVRSGSAFDVLAINKDTYFSGNYTDNGGVKDFNSVHLEYGSSSASSMNLAAAKDKTIYFNDGITSDNIANTIVIDDFVDTDGIGMELSTVNEGEVVFNDVVSDLSIALNSGILILGRENQYTQAGCVGNGCRDYDITSDSLFDNVNLTMGGGKLDTINGVIQNTNIEALTLNGNSYYAIDVDLANLRADHLSANSVAGSGTIFIDGLNFISANNAMPFDINIANTTIMGDIELSTDADINYESGVSQLMGNYMIGYENTTGNLSFDIYDLPAAVQSTIASKVYTINSDESINRDIGDMGGVEMTINGGGNDIVGNAFKGINVLSGQTLNIKNVGTISGLTNSAIFYASGSFGSIEADFNGNSNVGPTSGIAGGAIDNEGIIESIVGNFTNNFVENDTYASGGAINNEGTINSILGNFEYNYTTSSGQYRVFGGAINYYGNSDTIKGNFVGNYAENTNATDGNSQGGAIYLGSGSSVDLVEGVFSNNYATAIAGQVDGGAIGISRADVGTINGEFYNNYAYSQNSYSWGGAIQNFETIVDLITGHFEGNLSHSKSTTLSTNGGAIHNSGYITEINATFINNKSYSEGNRAYGGAIRNLRTINSIYGEFLGNIAISDAHSAYGGALMLETSTTGVDNISADFVGNYAKTTGVSRNAWGGAIYSNADDFIIHDSNFFDNYVIGTNTGLGGAIYANNSDIGVLAINDDVYFSGNHTLEDTVKTYNSVYLDHNTDAANLNLAATNDKTIYFNDGIASDNISNAINIGDFVDTDGRGEDYSINNYGSVVFNDVVSNVTVNLNSGTLVLGRENKYTQAGCVGVGCRDYDVTSGSLFDNVNVNLGDGLLDMSGNGVIQTTDINNLDIGTDASIGIDFGIVGSSAVADNFNITSISGLTSIDIGEINFVGSWVDGTYTDVLVFNQNIDVNDIGVYTNNGTYDITGNGDGTIDIDKSSVVYNLTQVIETPANQNRMYIMSADEIILTQFGNMQDSEVAVDGNNFAIIGNDGGVFKNGAEINQGQEFVLNNVSSIEGFNATNGAIETAGELTINAVSTNTVFENNQGADIIVAATGEANLNTAGSSSIVLNSGLAGSGVVNKDGLGVLEILSDDNSFSGTFNLNEGVVKLSANANDFFATAGSLNVFGCMVDVANGSILTTSLGNLTLNSNLELAFDVNLETLATDKFELATLTNNGSYNILVERVNVLADATAETVKVDISDDANINSILGLSSNVVAEGTIYNYNIDDAEIGDGVLIFNQKDKDDPSSFSPAIMTSSVARNSYYLTALDTLKHSLSDFNYGDYDFMRNLSSGDMFDKWAEPWIKIYGSDEDVKLNGFDVNNETYATMIGVDTRPEIKENGYIGVYSVYGAYVSSEQKYDSVNIDQESYFIGGRAMFEKGRTFSAISANIGSSTADAINAFGKETIDMYSVGINSKTGYNFNLYCDDYIMQLNMNLAYLYVYTQSYTNSSGIKVNADDLHALNIAPEIKFIAHYMDDLSAYAGMSYNWSVTNDAQIKANDINLPEISEDPYAEFKLGVKKGFYDGLEAYAEASASFGGRDGYSGQIGLKWSF